MELGFKLPAVAHWAFICPASTGQMTCSVNFVRKIFQVVDHFPFWPLIFYFAEYNISWKLLQRFNAFNHCSFSKHMRKVTKICFETRTPK
jgi:hypothetical protein